MIFLVIMTALPDPVIGAGDKAIVLADFLNIRSLPGLEGSVIAIAPKGSQVEIVEFNNGWLKVRHNGTFGYIRNKSEYVYVVRISDTPSERKNTGETLKNYKEQAGNLSQKIEESRRDLKSLSREETNVLNILNQIDNNLAESKKKIQVYRSEISELKNELKNSEKASRELEKRVDSLNEYAKKRLVAIYKMNRLGTLSMLASADSISDFLFRKQALERIFSHDEKIRQDLIEDQKQLDEVLNEIRIRKEKKLKLESELKDQIVKIALEKKKRTAILSEVRKKKTMEQELFESYRHAAELLDKKILSLNTESHDGGFVKHGSDKSFESFKGLLNMPVNGTITSRFGSYRDNRLNLDLFSNGISFRADRGEPIHAVKDGVILFAGWFKGYGKMIIIDHGQHYYTVYAHAEELFKDKGDPVESGEVIATVGDSGSISGPELYFEVRHYGKPVDPLEWIRKG